MTDPRPSLAAGARLLEDPHEHIRSTAARHPHLLVRILVGLLRKGTGSAGTAAGNPALPAEVVRRVFERLVPLTAVVPVPPPRGHHT
ncbi:hypothetical protein ACH3Y9_30045 [Streptomyces sp. WSLK1-5]|uniref:hypothetical protein n=1 Tax=Streptomyces sp. WSLK1-5 TaxID=3375473 RepID=UPI0037A6A001